MNENLFDDIFSMPPLEGPKEILESYATLLNTRSHGKVSGVVKVVPTSKPELVCQGFSVHSQATNYSFRLFAVFHEVLLYPCVVNADSNYFSERTIDTHNIGGARIAGIYCDNDKELRDAVELMFQNANVKRIIHAVYSQR